MGAVISFFLSSLFHFSLSFYHIPAFFTWKHLSRARGGAFLLPQRYPRSVAFCPSEQELSGARRWCALGPPTADVQAVVEVSEQNPQPREGGQREA